MLESEDESFTSASTLISDIPMNDLKSSLLGFGKRFRFGETIFSVEYSTIIITMNKGEECLFWLYSLVIGNKIKTTLTRSGFRFQCEAGGTSRAIERIYLPRKA